MQREIVESNSGIIIFVIIMLSPGIVPLAAGYSGPASIIFSPPSLQSAYSPTSTEVRSGQQVIIATKASHSFGDKAMDMIALIEVRDGAGVTQYLAWQSGIVSIGGQKQIGVSWIPPHGGSYEIRIFAIKNDWEQPVILSSVIATPVQIKHSCQGNAACFTGTITNVVDGDTLDIGEERIRLTLVNTPERGDLEYNEAKRFTESLCPVGSEAIVDEDDGQTEGSYGRMIAKVYCSMGAFLLNEELLRANLADILSQFCDVSEFAGEPWAKKYACPSSI